MIRDGIGEDAFSRAFKFGIVRNPWDWAMSNYLFNSGVHMPYVDFKAVKAAPTAILKKI